MLFRSRKQQFAALKRYLEQEQARVDREMPGATDKQKAEAIGAKLSDSLAASRRKKKIEALTAVLSGKKLQRERNQSDRDYTGGGFYDEESETLYLFVDGTFRYEKRSFRSVSGGRLALSPSEHKKTDAGTWAVELVRDEPHLVLKTGGSVRKSWQTRDGGVGVQYLDGERWNRYRM